jgi:hypothetical protein
MAKPEQPNLRDGVGCEGASRGAMRDSSVKRKAPWAVNGFGSTFFHKKVEEEINISFHFFVAICDNDNCN